jgi:hypothetical protein
MLQAVLRYTFIIAVLLVNKIQTDEQKFFLSPKKLSWDESEKVSVN